jgi:DNA-binding response OmpR family regulator
VATDLISAANHSALMRYSLIVLDINLDQTNGLDLLEKLREKKIVECPVIVLSGDFDPKDVPRSKALGVVSFLVKPVSGQKLEAAINEALAK